MGQQSVAQTKLDQDPSRIRRQLNSRAGLLEPFGLFENSDAEAVPGERKRSGQAGDAGAGDDNDTRGRQALAPGR
jgi:hypothetical protein